MPIDIDKVVGAELPALSHSWDADDVILYHLGIGAGDPATAEGELEYCYEGKLKVLPTFAVVPVFNAIAQVMGVDGMEINPIMILHGEQAITIHQPLPTNATVESTAVIKDVFDKGKGAAVIVETETRDQASTLLATNRFLVFVRGEGGFGGPSGPPPGNAAPERPADLVVESTTLPQQALLYRLSGDKNPLHADPGFAAMGGFDRPILHGLCSYGIVCKAAVDGMLDGDVKSVADFSARFAGVVFPGETIVTSMWREDGRVVLAASCKERGTPVISNAAIAVQ